MKVTIKDLSVNMEIKNKGIALDVYDTNGAYLGDLIVTKTKLTWCKGKTSQKNGASVTWKKFIAQMEST